MLLTRRNRPAVRFLRSLEPGAELPPVRAPGAGRIGPDWAGITTSAPGLTRPAARRTAARSSGALPRPAQLARTGGRGGRERGGWGRTGTGGGGSQPRRAGVGAEHAQRGRIGCHEHARPGRWRGGRGPMGADGVRVAGLHGSQGRRVSPGRMAGRAGWIGVRGGRREIGGWVPRRRGAPSGENSTIYVTLPGVPMNNH